MKTKHLIICLSIGCFFALIFACSSTKEVRKAPVSSAVWEVDSSENNNEEKSARLKEKIEEVEEATASLEYYDKTYKNNIRTVQLYKKNDPLSYPVLFLGDNRQLELHFDDLDASFKTYSYQFVHCNANWEPSGLVAQEYMEGFMNGFITDYGYSFNTLVRFIHYKMAFPNEEIRFKRSGNYLIKVYEDNNPEKLILSRRFFIVDKRITINSNIHLATLARYRDFKHEIDFTLNLGGYEVTDPFQDLKVVLMQNRRWDNTITDLKPLFVRTPELVYNYETGNLFDGNNEYRFFEVKDIRYQSINVDGIQNINGKTHVFLLEDEPRSFKRYYSQQDINGQRLIKRDESVDSDKDADYLQVHFTLKRQTPVYEGDVYVFGELSDWQFKEEFKMKYVEVNNEYVVEVPLKQGFYNYNYVVLPKNGTQGDMAIIEGTHSDTENDYYLFVYHRKQGEIYDRLIGYEVKNSYNSFD